MYNPFNYSATAVFDEPGITFAPPAAVVTEIMMNTRQSKLKFANGSHRRALKRDSAQGNSSSLFIIGNYGVGGSLDVLISGGVNEPSIVLP